MKSSRVYDDDEFLMLSGIQHFTFCRRQWALIQIEQLWEENMRTAEGRAMHDNAHDPYFSESRGEVIISRAMPVFSRELGVSGECDIVEFRKSSCGVSLNGRNEKYTVYPVEYKRGGPKDSDEDILQLVCQSICLEEMLCCEITEGAIYYGKTKHRLKVPITDELRERVKTVCSEMHEYYSRGYVPKVKPTKSCNACSLKELCLPKLMKPKDFRTYLDENLGKEDV